MTSITLRQLRYFEALARHRHFGDAARACSVSQPALSMQVRDLEAAVGVALIERRARAIGITPAGEELARRAEAIARAVAELEDVARALGDPLGGITRLGVIPTAAPYLLPAVFRALAEQYPGLDLRVRETQTEGLLRELGAGRIDLALVAMPIREAGLVSRPLFDEPFLMVRPAASAGSPMPEPTSLGERLLLLEEGHCFRDQALAVCGTPGERGRAVPAGRLDASSLSTLVQVVSAGLGLTLLPAMAAPFEARRAGVDLAAFPAGGPARTLGLVWRETTPLAERFEAVGRVIDEVGRRQVAEGTALAAAGVRATA
ncbi:MAG: LysR substrate-binding domain-containing protein [Pseudomonadota bacterium]